MVRTVLVSCQWLQQTAYSDSHVKPYSAKALAVYGVTNTTRSGDRRRIKLLTSVWELRLPYKSVNRTAAHAACSEPVYGDPHNNCNYNEFGVCHCLSAIWNNAGTYGTLQHWPQRDSGRVGGAEQEDSLSKARVKHGERGHQMNGWPLRARLCASPEISPESKSVQTLHKSLGWNYKPRSPVSIRMLKQQQQQQQQKRTLKIQ